MKMQLEIQKSAGKTFSRDQGKCLNRTNCAFTQLDLLAVILMLAVLFLVFLPALANPGINAKSIQCLNNHRRLCNAWRMYADDSNDRIPYSGTGSNHNPRNGNSVMEITLNPSDPNYWAWSGAHLDFTGGTLNPSEWAPTVDMMLRPLWKYVRTVTAFKCPSDQSVCPSATGALVPRLLSISMNMCVGGFCPGVNGPGDDGGWSFADSYRIFSKTTDLTAPGPAKTFVFMDHRPDNLNWSNFMTDMTGYSPANPALFNFQEWPGFFHDGGAGVSFADGHIELHRWTDRRTTPPAGPNGTFLNSPSASPNNPDIAWLQDHSTRPK